MKVDLSLSKVAKYAGYLSAIGIAVWQLLGLIFSIGRFIDDVNLLKNQVKEMYTKEEVQFRIQYEIAKKEIDF